jgi:hypothetical protein
MEYITDLIQILVPSLLVLYAVFLVVKSFLQKEFDKRLIDIKIKNSETVLPLRLQAYERVCLLLERITPNNILVRLNDPAYNAKAFQQVLLKEIREELNHNLSQQVYLTDQAWNSVKMAVEEVTVLINNSSSGLTEENSAIELAKAIFENMMKLEKDPVSDALTIVKDEIREFF